MICVGYYGVYQTVSPPYRPGARAAAACAESSYQRCCQDTSRYGFLGLDAHGEINDVESQWMNKTLPKPTLNITAFYMSSNDTFYGYDWLDPRTRTQPFSSRSNLVFFSPPSNATFSVDYVEQNGQCQPTKVCISPCQ